MSCFWLHFLRFWFIIVSVVSGVGLLYRLAIVFLPKIRMSLLRSKARLSNRDDIDSIANKCQVGDWFVLYQLGKNMDPLIFRELIQDLGKRLRGEHPV